MHMWGRACKCTNELYQWTAHIGGPQTAKEMSHSTQKIQCLDFLFLSANLITLTVFSGHRWRLLDRQREGFPGHLEGLPEEGHRPHTSRRENAQECQVVVRLVSLTKQFLSCVFKGCLVNVSKGFKGLGLN